MFCVDLPSLETIKLGYGALFGNYTDNQSKLVMRSTAISYCERVYRLASIKEYSLRRRKPAKPS